MPFRALSPLPIPIPAELQTDLLFAWPGDVGSASPGAFVGSGSSVYFGGPHRFVLGFAPASGRDPFTVFCTVVTSATPPLAETILNVRDQVAQAEGIELTVASGQILWVETSNDGVSLTMASSVQPSTTPHVVAYVHQPFNFRGGSAYRAAFLDGVLTDCNANIASSWLAQNPTLVGFHTSGAPTSGVFTSGVARHLYWFGRAFTAVEVERFSRLFG